jgi:hypothetical protein
MRRRPSPASACAAAYDLPVARRSLRLAVALVGLAAFVYALASPTGGWLGTPPWYERTTFVDFDILTAPHHPGALSDATTVTFGPRASCEWISGVVAAAGLALVAFAAWPRRRALSPLDG